MNPAMTASHERAGTFSPSNGPAMIVTRMGATKNRAIASASGRAGSAM